MAKLRISHHERVAGHPHRWHVHLEGRAKPVLVELPEEDRQRLDMSDDEIDALLPTALQRRQATEANRDDELFGAGEERDVTWDAPVRVYQTHFIG
jgi:hypothetical protein